MDTQKIFLLLNKYAGGLYDDMAAFILKGLK